MTGEVGHVGHSFFVDPTDVGADHDVVELQEMEVRVGGFGAEDVEPRAVQMPRDECLVKRVLVDNPAARGV